jgi:hypothetical protein
VTTTDRALAGQRAEQACDRVGRGLVELAGGFVGEHDARLGRERAGDRDALLLAAREL